ncbi:sulfatase maturation enzyme AslB (radical SAM superfamily) [Thermostichus sp. OS-CIW-33]
MSTIPPNLLDYQRRALAMRESSYIDFPAHVHLETMARCNAACNFCPYSSLERKGAKMDDSLIEKIVNDLKDIPRLHRFQLSPFKVNEPLLRLMSHFWIHGSSICLHIFSLSYRTLPSP